MGGTISTTKNFQGIIPSDHPSKGFSLNDNPCFRAAVRDCIPEHQLWLSTPDGTSMLWVTVASNQEVT